MQLRMLRRRSAGAITILGDIAQSSGPISYTSWSDVARCLAPDMAPSVEELRLAYRVPADVMELALPLLPLIAPEVAAPIAYRSGDEPPRFVRSDAEHLVSTAVREAAAEAARDGRTALIAPAEILAQIEPLLPDPEQRVRRDGLGDPGAHAACLEGPRVRPGRPGRAGGDRRRRDRGATGALRRAYSRDEDAGCGSRGGVAGRARDGLSTSWSSPRVSWPMPSTCAKSAIMNADRRPGSSTSLRLMRPSRSRVSQQPRTELDVDPGRVGAGLEPEPAARLVARDPVRLLEVLLGRGELARAAPRPRPSPGCGYQRDRRPRRLV